jgi:hypothetical protein
MFRERAGIGNLPVPFGKQEERPPDNLRQNKQVEKEAKPPLIPVIPVKRRQKTGITGMPRQSSASERGPLR